MLEYSPTLVEKESNDAGPKAGYTLLVNIIYSWNNYYSGVLYLL